MLNLYFLGTHKNKVICRRGQEKETMGKMFFFFPQQEKPQCEQLHVSVGSTVLKGFKKKTNKQTDFSAFPFVV